MKFTFTDKKVNIPNRVHTYAEKKIGKLDRYFQTEPEASIERQLRKNKSRLEKRLRKGAFDQPNDAFFVPDVDADEEPSYQLVRTKRFFFRPMNVDEAILQMNLVGHTFFAFRNEDEGGAFSVVYKRNDGGYGIIVDQD